MNIQVLTESSGRLLWASPAPPGPVHDLTAVRTHGVIDTLARIRSWAHKAYQGADRYVPPLPGPSAQAVAAPVKHHPRQDPVRRLPRRNPGSEQGTALAGCL